MGEVVLVDVNRHGPTDMSLITLPSVFVVRNVLVQAIWKTGGKLENTSMVRSRTY